MFFGFVFMPGIKPKASYKQNLRSAAELHLWPSECDSLSHLLCISKLLFKSEKETNALCPLYIYIPILTTLYL